MALRVTVSEIAHKRMQTKSAEARLKKSKQGKRSSKACKEAWSSLWRVNLKKSKNRMKSGNRMQRKICPASRDIHDSTRRHEES